MRWQVPTGLAFLLPLVLAVLVACLIPRHINKALHSGIQDQIIWSENSSTDTYNRYARDDHPDDPIIYSRFHLYNITNLHDVKAGHKPELQQLGPFTYRKHTVKKDIWFDSNGKVSFTRDEFFTELNDNSKVTSLDDIVTTVNIPLLGALAKVHSVFGHAVALQLLLHVIASFHDPNINGLFMTRTVRELLWGYDDPLLQKLHFLAPGLQTRFQLIPNATASSQHFRPHDVMNTGLHNISQIWDTEMWENLTSIKSWKFPHIEAVQGSDGTQFRPGLQQGDKITVWAAQLFRSTELIANETTDLNGISLLHFSPDLAQGAVNPTYFQDYEGLLNITSPTAAGPEGRAGMAGPPVYLSNAHFCETDPAVAETVSGLHCHPDKHITFIDVEPMSGMTLRAAKRVQMSTEYGPEWSAIEPHVKRTFLPIFWAEEGSEATPDQCTLFKSQVYKTQKLSKIVFWVSIGFACFCGALALILLSAPWWDQRHREDPEAQNSGGRDQQEPLLANESHEAEDDPDPYRPTINSTSAPQEGEESDLDPYAPKGGDNQQT